MNKWPHRVPSLTQTQIHRAIKDSDWQAFRKQLKGLSTYEKLERLDDYLAVHKLRGTPDVEIQVANYINALRRGGQLDEHNMVKR